MGLAKLVLTEAFQARKHVVIDHNPFVIGRSAECDLVLDGSGISREHTQILYNGEEFHAEDLNSKNGTYVNGTKIDNKRFLSHGDVLTIGSVDLTFEMVKQHDLAANLESNIKKFRFALRSTSAINSHKLLDPILNEIMDGVMRLTQAERGFLMIEGENGELQIARSVNINPEGFRNQGSSLSFTAVEKAIETRKSVAISDAVKDTFFGDQTSVQMLELKTLVCVPILGNGEVIGIIYADSNRREQEFTQLDVDVLESLAENAAIAIQNVRLNEHVWKLIEQAGDVLTQLNGQSGIDRSLQESIHETLESLAALKHKAGGDIS